MNIGYDLVAPSPAPKTASTEGPAQPATEASLLARMAASRSLPEQRDLAAQLERLRSARVASTRQDRELDLASRVVESRYPTLPVAQHTQHTAATDWLGEVSPDEVDLPAAERAVRAEATLWYSRAHEAVRSDPEELRAQAHGAATRAAGGYGARAREVREAFLAQVAHLASREDLVAVGARVDVLRQIVQDHRSQPIDGQLVDPTTASMLVKVHDALSPQNQAGFERLPLAKLVEFGWSKVSHRHQADAEVALEPTPSLEEGGGTEGDQAPTGQPYADPAADHDAGPGTDEYEYRLMGEAARSKRALESGTVGGASSRQRGAVVTKLSVAEFDALRRVDASSLRPGDRFFNPGAGMMYREAADGRVRLQMGWTPEVPGTMWTVEAVRGGQVLAVNHAGKRAVAPAAHQRVLKVQGARRTGSYKIVNAVGGDWASFDSKEEAETHLRALQRDYASVTGMSGLMPDPSGFKVVEARRTASDVTRPDPRAAEHPPVAHAQTGEVDYDTLEGPQEGGAGVDLPATPSLAEGGPVEGDQAPGQDPYVQDASHDAGPGTDEYEDRLTGQAGRRRAYTSCSSGECMAAAVAKVDGFPVCDHHLVTRPQGREVDYAAVASRRQADGRSSYPSGGGMGAALKEMSTEDLRQSIVYFEMNPIGGDPSSTLTEMKAELARRTARRRQAADVPPEFLEQQKGSGEGGSGTCAECGDPIERDPEGEEPRTWHHDGSHHDHEARPKGREGRRAAADLVDARKLAAFASAVQAADISLEEYEQATHIGHDVVESARGTYCHTCQQWATQRTSRTRP